MASLVLGGAGCATGDTASVGDQDTGIADVSDDGGDGATDTGDGAVDTGPFMCASDGDCAHDPNGTACDTTTGKCVQCLPSNDWCPDGTYCDSKTNRCQTGCRTSLDCVAAPTTDAGTSDASSDAGSGDAASSDAGSGDAGSGDAADTGKADASSSDAGDAGKADATSSDASSSDATSSDATSSDAISSDASSSDGGAPLVCDPTTHQCVGCTDSTQCPLGSLCDATTNACYPGCTPTHGCPGAFSCCSGTCVDLNSSIADCGTCGKACPKVMNGAAVCMKGTCAIGTCATGTADCNGNFDDGCEVNTTNDPANCGSCKSVCSNVHGTPSCAASKCAIACDTGYQDCDTDVTNGCETNTQTDTNHCGTCANACVKANDTPACNSGTCIVSACDSGYGDCNLNPGDGCETNLNTSTTSCGKCNSPCIIANGTPACTSGTCGVATCKAGYGDCNTDPTDGCETNLNKDTTNCGKCGTVCVVSNGTPACTTGACSIASCATGYADCNKSASDGCEADTRVDKTNCGSCGTVCGSANGTASCSASACQIACNTGYADCDKVNANGCEIQTAGTDVNNCGGCGTKCSPGNASGKCTAGACGISACNTGYADCNKAPGDGCEVNLNTDGSNCGACGTKCSLANASAICTGGGCAIGACAAGFADCDGVAANGCEVNLQTDASHCGACPIACFGSGGTPKCTAGTCSTACSAGYADCNGIASDGCEKQISIDPNNCGGCGNVCNLAHTTLDTCVASTCRVVTCAAGWSDCNGLPGDGCEVNTTGSDPNNCGGCGTKCSVINGSPICTAGSCGFGGCNAGFGNCDGNTANGCETNITNSVTSCGACGNACAAACAGNATAFSCASSACSITACAPGYYNIDGACAGGCECKAVGESSSCAAPTAMLSLSPGGTTTASGNLPTSTDDGYYSVTFSGNTSTAYHPHVTLTSGASEFEFDILTNCSGGQLSCGSEATSSANLSDWEVLYTAGDPTSAFLPIPAVGSGGTIIIRVHRKIPAAVSCNGFTLTVTG